MKTLRILFAMAAAAAISPLSKASVHESNTSNCTIKTITVRTETWSYNSYGYYWFQTSTSYSDITISYNNSVNMDDVYGDTYRVYFTAISVTQAYDTSCETWQSFDEPQGWTYGAWSPGCSTQPPCGWVTQSRTNQQVHLTGERSNLGHVRNTSSYTESQTQNQTVAGCGALTWTPFEEQLQGWHEVSSSPSCGSYWEDQSFAQQYNLERTTRSGERSQCGDERNVHQNTYVSSSSRSVQGCKPLNDHTFTEYSSWYEVDSWPSESDYLSGESFTQYYEEERTVTTGWRNDRGDEWGISESTDSRQRSRTAYGTKQVPTITWSAPASITYGTALSSAQLNASASTAGTFTYNHAAGTVLGAGSQSLSVTFTPNNNTSYATATKSVTLVVNRAPLVITAQNATRSAGASNPAFTASYSGFVNGDTSAAIGGLVLSTTATTASPPGEYPITPSGASAPNYNISYVNGVLTVSGASQTVTLSTGATSVGAGQAGLITAIPATLLSFAASGGSTGVYTWAVDGVVQSQTGAALDVTFTVAGPHNVTVFAAANEEYVASAVATIKVLVSTGQAWTVSTGTTHMLALRSAHTVTSWGANTYGQLGDGTTLPKSAPGTALGLADIVAIAAGDYHSLAITNAGLVWGWGRNDAGQLSAAAATSQLTPAQIVSLSGIVQVAAGTAHSLALKDDGTVWGFGANSQGQIGDGSTNPQNVPVQVMTNVLMVAAGAEHSVALKADGTVWAWGRNDAGQLGDGTTSNRLVPFQVGSLSDIVAVAAGGGHTLALRSDGVVWAWGANESGQLGDGTTTNRTAPVSISGISAVIDIAAGSHHSAVLDASGAVWNWGRNTFGQLGDGTTTNRSVPTHVSPISDIIHVVAGGDHTVAVRNDGTVWAWGGNGFGQISAASMGITQVPIRLISSANDTDEDGMLDTLETQHFGGLSHSGAEDTDADGLTDVQEIFLGSAPMQADSDEDTFNDATDFYPTDYFNDEAPILAKLGGDTQATAVNEFNSAPFDLAVFDAAGTEPLVNAPVTFAVTQGGGLLATANTGTPPLASSVDLRTDQDGTVQVYYKQPSTVGITSLITATAGTAQVVFQTQSTSSGQSATVTFTGLSYTYDGSPHAATVTTSPAGLAVSVTYNGSGTIPTNAGSYAVVATVTESGYHGNASGTLTIAKATPSVSWSQPAPIVYGTTLSNTQLNAVASVAGSLSYTPAAGATLTAGTHSLNVVFTPSDTTNYEMVTEATTLVVSKAVPLVTWTPPATVLQGVPLDATQLNATAGIPGAFVYTPAAGTILPLGLAETLAVVFTPTDATNYTAVAVSRTINVVSPLDTDGNGLADAWELQYLGHLGVDPNADADGDGMTNADECAAGRNPQSNLDSFALPATYQVVVKTSDEQYMGVRSDWRVEAVTPQ